MTNYSGGIEPNRAPTADEIHAEALYLDAIGIMVSGITLDNPVDPTRYISKADALEEIIDQMAERGWAYAGSGFFSAVFIKGGLALKMGLKQSDTGSMYAAWCRANQGLPGVPAVYAVSKFNRCYLMLTRRYTDLSREWLDEDHEDYIPELAEEFSAIRAAVNIGCAEGAERFGTASTAIAIRDFFNGVVDFDLHKGNVMMDDQGELVITDPVSYGACSGYDTSDSSYYYTGYSTRTASFNSFSF